MKLYSLLATKVRALLVTLRYGDVFSKLRNNLRSCLYTILRWNWMMILLGIISVEIGVLVFSNAQLINPYKSLEIILTVNGLFSAILVSYFFNRVIWIMNVKKDIYSEAEELSQKITELRRIFKKLTEYYDVWRDDDATKNLLDYNQYKNVDYYDYKLMSYSDYIPKDKELINKMMNEDSYSSGPTDLYLGMVSIVYDRKSRFQVPGEELYKDYLKKGIYRYEFIEKCMRIEYASRLGYWFNRGCNYINYLRVSEKSREYILSACSRIDKKYGNREIDDHLLADICDDMHEHYFKELYRCLKELRKGLSGLNLIIYLMLISSLTFGVLIPFLIYFTSPEKSLSLILTKGLVGINLSLLFFFVTNLYGLIKREITWT